MIRIFQDLEALSQAAAEYIVTVGKRCIGKRGKFDLVLSGGKTPEGTYQILSSRYLRERHLWEKTHVYWSDERCVPRDHLQSNYHLARMQLLDLVPIPSGHVHPMYDGSEDPCEAAEAYEAKFPLSADLLMLGMGADGHTASLFPHSAALGETKRRILCVEAPVEPRLRLTVTPRVIANAIEVLVLVSGEEKALTLKKVFSQIGDVQETPARLVRRALWFVEKLAAERIGKDAIDDEVNEREEVQ
jgi:6-phosphogluconolactonase